MKIKDGRGTYMKTVANKNKKKVQRYFERNPEASKKDCQRALNMAYTTVQRHLKDLGWV